MRKAALALLLLWAAGAVHADGAPEQAARAPAHAPIKQRLRAHGAEVAKLEQAVSRQEAQTREAGRRLQQQDREIEQLRRQIEQLSPARSAGRQH